VGGLELGPQPIERGAVEGDVGVVERGVLGAGQLAGDQVGDERQPEPAQRSGLVSG
jgi:hypothetical protein